MLLIRCIFYHHTHFLFLAFGELNFKFQWPSFREISRLHLILFSNDELIYFSHFYRCFSQLTFVSNTPTVTVWIHMLKWRKIFVTRQDLNRSNHDSSRNFCSLLGSTASELGLISTAALLKIKTIFKSVHSFTLPSARFISALGSPLERCLQGLHFLAFLSHLNGFRFHMPARTSLP